MRVTSILKSLPYAIFVFGEGIFPKGNYSNQTLTRISTTRNQSIFMKERMLHPDSYVPKTEIVITTNATKMAEIRGYQFLKNLRIFVTAEKFDFKGFDSQITEYRNDLADLVFDLENHPEYEESVGKTIAYLKRIFKVLVGAAENMKRYEKSKLPGHDLVYGIIELEARAMLLYDLSGLRDRKIENHKAKAEKLYDSLSLLFTQNVQLGLLFSQLHSFVLHIVKALKLIDGLLN